MRGRLYSFLLLAGSIAVLGACSEDDDPTAVVNPLNPFVDEVFSFTVENEIQFGTAVNGLGTQQSLFLNLFRPTNDPEGSRPAIVWLHGGGLSHGHKGEMTDYARRFAKRGYVAVAIDYRLFDVEFDYRNPNDAVADVARRAAQHDAQAAVRWLRANAAALRIDPNKIVIGGYSAGGTTALRVLFHPDDAGESGNPGQSSAVAAAVAIAGSPAHNTMDGSDMPFLLVHGDLDTRVSYQDVAAECSRMSGCELITVTGGNHALLSASQDLIVDEAAKFLSEKVASK